MFRNELRNQKRRSPWLRNQSAAAVKNASSEAANHHGIFDFDGLELQIGPRLKSPTPAPRWHCLPTPVDEARHVVAMTRLTDPPRAK